MMKKPCCGACGTTDGQIIDGFYVVRTKAGRKKMIASRMCASCQEQHSRLLR